MRIVGITMVRNEADVVDLSIRHHLRSGCQTVLVVDNGSTDATPTILGRLAKRDPRVQWTRDSSPFRQSDVMTALAAEAHRRGADWVLPFDADEFWWCAPDTTLPEFLDDAAGAGAFAVPVVNLVQHRHQRRSSRRALLAMRMRAVPVPPAHDAIDLVSERRIGFVEIEYPPKTLFRAGPDVLLSSGSHVAVGVDGDLRTTTDLACLHAPLRSSQAFTTRVERGRRLAETSADEETGWHWRRWVDLSERAELGGEWSANSHLDGHLDVYGRPHRVEPDDRLHAAVRPLLARGPIGRWRRRASRPAGQVPRPALLH